MVGNLQYKTEKGLHLRIYKAVEGQPKYKQHKHQYQISIRRDYLYPSMVITFLHP